MLRAWLEIRRGSMSKRVYLWHLKYIALHGTYLFNAADENLQDRVLIGQLFDEYFSVSAILTTEYSIL